MDRSVSMAAESSGEVKSFSDSLAKKPVGSSAPSDLVTFTKPMARPENSEDNSNIGKDLSASHSTTSTPSASAATPTPSSQCSSSLGRIASYGPQSLSVQPRMKIINGVPTYNALESEPPSLRNLGHEDQHISSVHEMEKMGVDSSSTLSTVSDSKSSLHPAFSAPVPRGLTTTAMSFASAQEADRDCDMQVVPKSPATPGLFRAFGALSSLVANEPVIDSPAVSNKARISYTHTHSLSLSISPFFSFVHAHADPNILVPLSG